MNNETAKRKEAVEEAAFKAITLVAYGVKSDEVNRITGISKGGASVYRSIYEAITTGDYSYFNGKSPDASAYNLKVKEVCAWMAANGKEIRESEVWEKIRATQNGCKVEPESNAIKEEANPATNGTQDDLFYIRVLQYLACLPKILTAVEGVSNKLTVLNQRIYDPVNAIDGNVADLVDAHNTVLRKIDRIAKAVSKFDGDGSPTPTTVIDSIDEGFTDVCAKLDTVRFKLEKAIK